MKKRYLDLKFLKYVLAKSKLAFDLLSFFCKMGLEFFSAGLDLFKKKTHKKRA